ncbi:MAG: hypothetical protein AAF542_23840 [Pseudomonadota bacterium]
MTQRVFNDSDVPSVVGKTAPVTGGIDGLGFEVARILAANRANVFISCRYERRRFATFE